jgi:hypothetical protein
VSRRKALAAAAALALASLAMPSPSRAAAAPEDAGATPAERLLAARGPAVVPIRIVMKIDASFQGQSISQEKAANALGAVVDPSGLVVASSLLTGDDGDGVFSRLLNRMIPGIQLKVTPSRVRVVVGEALEEKEAIVVARDAELGLGWLQIVDPPKDLASVDLARGDAPSLRVGQPVACVSRLARGFDHVPAWRDLYVTRRVESPRLLFGIASDPHVVGLPVFDEAGSAAGVVVARMSDDTTTIDMTGGSGIPNIGALFVLPLADVRKSLDAAKKRVPDALARAKAEKEAPKPPGSPRVEEDPPPTEEPSKEPVPPGMG